MEAPLSISPVIFSRAQKTSDVMTTSSVSEAIPIQAARFQREKPFSLVGTDDNSGGCGGYH